MAGMQGLHWKQYEKDNLQAKLVRGQILGLPEGQIPTWKQIDESDIFTIHLPQPQEDTKEERVKVNVMDVHSYWLPYLHEKEALGDCPSKEYQPPAGWPKLYTAEGLQDHVPEAVKKWGKDPLLSLIALINHQMPLIPKYHLLSCLYNMAALKKGSIGAGDDQKQFSCSPSCGVPGQKPRLSILTCEEASTL